MKKMILAALMLLVWIPAPAHADPTTVVIEGHGFVGSVGCPNAKTEWPGLDTVLAQNGYTGPRVGIAWLCSDSGDLDIKPYGDDTNPNNYNVNMSFTAIAKANMRALYDVYWSKGIHTNVVGHSAYGLIMRYGMGMLGQPGWPPLALVDHVVTISTPYQGWDSPNAYMFLNCPSLYTQCKEMTPGSAFITAMNAMPKPATDWTCIGGSPKDQVATIKSACGVPADTKIDYYDKTVVNYEHSAYLTDTSQAENVKVKVNGVITLNRGHSLREVWKAIR